MPAIAPNQTGLDVQIRSVTVVHEQLASRLARLREQRIRVLTQTSYATATALRVEGFYHVGFCMRLRAVLAEDGRVLADHNGLNTPTFERLAADVEPELVQIAGLDGNDTWLGDHIMPLDPAGQPGRCWSSLALDDRLGCTRLVVKDTLRAATLLSLRLMATFSREWTPTVAWVALGWTELEPVHLEPTGYCWDASGRRVPFHPNDDGHVRRLQWAARNLDVSTMETWTAWVRDPDGLGVLYLFDVAAALRIDPDNLEAAAANPQPTALPSRLMATGA